MNLNKIRVNGIPVLIWGESSDKMIIAAHGRHSSKLDDCMWVLADEAIIGFIQNQSLIFSNYGSETDFDTFYVVKG